ncbi:aminodeoxychorismate synthase component I [Mesorhizobium sp. NBSH29]|uniref:aminodeoxychorismate synthase component I n=1 Tax=Mesorhizobium sp. NBSH29 TaxID=2654249 RepID=UPI0018964010|nr:aminodeoxychorismate synthase component I [Mesorhizobium sp. NBSH29]QPC85433.1 aminodeoxychorismate synthase component I [Mesorhizobium sp. NBSH29]
MSASPTGPFVLFRDDPGGHETLFTKPLEILAPTNALEFEAALVKAQAARRAGKWLAGTIAYEAGYVLEPKLAPLLPAQSERRVPLMCLGIFEAPLQRAVAPDAGHANSNGPIFNARATWNYDDYRPRFERVHRHLREGDCYQANLTFGIETEWSGTPLDAFNALTARQPVKYGALVDLGGPIILSRSPELFFEIDRQGWIETHPMKGTMRRGDTPQEDETLRETLRNDPKNQAENRMIVDLLRNDISLISEVGTLDVPELFRIETYPTVHQMVSRVRAKLLPDLTIRTILAALFPCGSITGAPKIRAMEILRGLETQPRDAYCGAIGWIAPEGPMRFSVAIRTITLFPEGEAVYNVGGGLVFDSTAEEEYQECLLKARFATGTVPAHSA